MGKKEDALQRSVQKRQTANRMKVRAATSLTEWEDSCLKAWDAGNTYPEIALAHGVSRSSVDQAIRASRQRQEAQAATNE